MKVMSLCLFKFFEDIVSATFLKYSKEGILSSSHVGIQNIPSDICYDDKALPGAIWTEVYSEPLQTSKVECFCVNSQHLKVVNWICKNTPS